VKAAIARPDIQEKLAGLGLRPVASSPAEFAEFLKNEQNRWAEVAKANNITLD
jgi:tripartite-type tricarboxylate transporter receptor subunit TctC